LSSIQYCQQLGCKVGRLVNAYNMTKIRRMLETNNAALDVIRYGWSAHLSNLFAKDIELMDKKRFIKRL